MKTNIILILSIFFITLFVTSCEQNILQVEENYVLSKDDTVLIKVKPYNEPFDLDTYIDSIYYLQLELTDESIIGDIYKIIVFEDHIYILDGQTSSLFIFDLNGKYISKICKIGNGPGEYNRLDYFDIDVGNKHIVITDLTTYWNIRYDMKGNFISRKKIYFNSQGLASHSSSKYVLHSNFRKNSNSMTPEYNLIFLDSLMKIEKAYFPYNSDNFSNPTIRFPGKPGGFFYTYSNELYFIYIQKNEIYKIEPEGLFFKYKFDIADNNFNYLRLNKKSGLHEYVESGKYWTLHNVYETPDIIYFSFYENTHPLTFQGFYSKSSKNMINSSRFTLSGALFPFETHANYNDWFIATLDIDKIIEWRDIMDKINDTFEERGYKEERDLFLIKDYLIKRKRLADNLTLDDNPILMFYKLKSF